MHAAVRDRERLQSWVRLPVHPMTLARWVDGPLRKAWGAKAATRVFHISLQGHDIQFADQFERASPSQRQVRPSRGVPGMGRTQLTAFNVSQALAWLARERREIPDQLERMERIPSLMAQLTGGGRT
jgi:hypothetical protein